MLKLQFSVDSCRRIPSPFGLDKDPEHPQITYIAICNVMDLPADIPMSTNPREQNFKTRVAKKIKDSFLDNQDQNFHLLNRGLTISAERAHFNNDTKILTVYFTDLEKHGDVDGGHTYKIILDHRHELKAEDGPRYVRLEIMTGVEDYFEDLADARNTSNQVEDKSLAELAKKFDLVKQAIAGQCYEHSIAYKENAEGEIDVADMVALLTMFNLDRYSETSHPVIAYSQKRKCIEYYISDIEKPNNSFYKMRKIMPDIFRLYSYAEEQFPKVYNREGNRRYGNIRGVIYKAGREFYHPKFMPLDHRISYETPRGFLYPVVGAFRALLKEDETGDYVWKPGVDVFDFFDQLAPVLVDVTLDRSKSLGNNPQSVGKDSGHWAQMYDKVDKGYLRVMVEQMMANQA